MSETGRKLEKDALDGLYAVARAAKKHLPEGCGISVVWFSKRDKQAGVVTLGDPVEASLAMSHLAASIATSPPTGMVVLAPDGTEH